MTTKTFLTSTGTVSLKALRALWRAFAAMMAAFGLAVVDSMKHASAAEDDDDPTGFQKSCRETDEYYANAAAHDFKDGWGS